MEKGDLVKAVDHILSAEELEIKVVAIPVSSEETFMLNIDPGSIAELINVFRVRISELIKQTDYKIYEFSKTENRKDGYYVYDIDEVPAKMKQLEIVISAKLPYLDVTVNPINKLDHLLVVISDGHKPIALYKKLHIGEKVYKSPNVWFGKYGGSKKMSTVDDEFLRIGGGFDVLYVDNIYIILDDKFAEKEFSLMSILNKESSKGLEQVERTKLLRDVKKLTSYSNSNAFARKLVKAVSKSNVVKAIVDGNISNTDVFTFISNVPELKDKLNVVGKKTKYISVNNREQAHAFLDLLNDDFLVSELTKAKYKSIDKDPRN